MMMTSNVIKPVKTAVEKPSRNSGSFAAFLNSLSTNFMAYLIELKGFKKRPWEEAHASGMTPLGIADPIALLTDVTHC